MALSRPPWELAALSRDETAIALCNRSAAFAFANNWGAALADAETVVALKRPWTKGHFRWVLSEAEAECRKSRALVGLGRLEEARQALIDGLQFEPEDKVSSVRWANLTTGLEQLLEGDRRQAQGRMNLARCTFNTLHVYCHDWYPLRGWSLR